MRLREMMCSCSTFALRLVDVLITAKPVYQQFAVLIERANPPC